MAAVKSHFKIVYRGNQSAPQTLVFAQGWPDTDTIFQNQYDVFEKDFRIASLVLPGYQPGTEDVVPYFGFTFEQLVLQMHTSIEEVMKDRPVSEKPIIIAHDWSAAVAYCVVRKFPDCCKKIVTLDAGAHFDVIQPTMKMMLVVVLYQLGIILAFFLPSFLGTPLAKFVGWVMSVPNYKHITSRLGYPYFQFLKGTAMRTLPPGLLRFVALPPQLEVLYVYGLNKPFTFHSQRFLDSLKNQPNSKHVGVPGYHWFFAVESIDRTNEEIRAFIAP